MALDALDTPTAVYVADDGRIYVADRGHSRLVRMEDMAGTGLVALGSGSGGVGPWSPEDVCLDRSGRIYLTIRPATVSCGWMT